MAESRGEIVGLDGGRRLLVGLPMTALSGALLARFFGLDADDGTAMVECGLATFGVYLLGHGAGAVAIGVSRIRSALLLRRRPSLRWAARCCDVERPYPALVLVVEQEGLSLLSLRGEQVRTWTWPELGGATVDRLSTDEHEWEALVLWSPEERRLAQLSFPQRELVLSNGVEFSVINPGVVRAIVLEGLQQNPAHAPDLQ